MRKLINTLLLTAAVAGLPVPAPADAAIVEDPCLADAVDSCDSDFGGGDYRTAAIRGWCYLIRWGWCEWVD